MSLRLRSPSDLNASFRMWSMRSERLRSLATVKLQRRRGILLPLAVRRFRSTTT
jgi:hypothetical protein